MKLRIGLTFLNEVAHWSNVGIIDAVLKQFKDPGEMTIKNAVQPVLQNPPTQTSDE